MQTLIQTLSRFSTARLRRLRDTDTLRWVYNCSLTKEIPDGPNTP